MREERFDFLVLLGDFMDMDAISHHAMEHGDFRSIEGKRLKKDYEAMSLILRRFRSHVGPKCKIYYFMGNHEVWAEKFIDKYPSLEGFLEVENNLPFKELNIEVVPARHHRKIGKVVFFHGDQNEGYTPRVHAKTMVELFNRNVVYGDKHTFQAFTKVSPQGINETHTAYAIPCLADTSPKWKEDKPNAWLNGFAVMHFTEKRFLVTPVISVGNGFIAPNGKEYQG